ncbi:unnamed protein product [Calicophoron daubneyi]|uniref:PH domain-containing protein n=1 Tax=Calicophoron daubneyi TaxID=300641 RepID=A0AAV2TWK5_CALDB
MGEVGRLIECVLSVRYRGKWKRRLCILERQATFTNSLRLFVMDTDKPICLIRDVVHAYIYFLDPNRRLAQGTLMLVCNHRVRCISFETFEELNKWVNVLEKNLTCNYFHADLVVASRESCLYGQARRHGRQLHRLLAQKRSVQTATLSTNRFRNGLMPTHGDGYLHVTRDRICFTTGPGCTRPRLLATWSFDNDEIVQCGTARLKSSSDSLDNEQASLFFLTAFPNHPEAPGSHLFISNQATELCDWIEKNNQTAICQAEWRRLTSLAAVLDASALSSHDKSGYHTADDGSVVTARPRLFDLEDSSLTSSLGIIHTVDLSHVCNTNVPLNCSQLTGCAPQNSSEVSRMRIKGRTESACFSGAAGNQSSVPRPDASDDQTSLECVQDQRALVKIPP